MEETEKNNDEEPQKCSLKSESSHSSIELNRSLSDYSATSGSCTDQISSTSDKRKDSLIEIIKRRELSYQTLESSGDGKSGSSSSYYASTSSSSQSLHTPSMPSSPEHPMLNPFARPTKVAPLHKQYGSSSDGALSDNAKDVSPKKKRWLKSSSDMSGSSGESQDTYSHQHSTPAELSSREVTHLDPPGLRSTPAEVSFECLQLSGESSKLASSCYSLPDPMSGSPTEAQSSDTFGDISRRFMSPKTVAEQCAVDEKKYTTDSLPKWVKFEREKRVDFDCTRECTDSSAKSSSSAASSQICGASFLDGQSGSGTQGNENRHVSTSQDFPSANSQSIGANTEENFEESCVYLLQEYPKKVDFKAANSVGVIEQTEEGAFKKIGDSSEIGISSPGVLQPSQSSVLPIKSINSKVVQMKMSSFSHGNVPEKSDYQSQNEEKSLGLGPSQVVDESHVAQEQLNEINAWGEKDKGLQKYEEGGLVTESHLSVKDTDMESPQKDFSPEYTTLEKDMELEMSQDLFNEKLDQIGTVETDLNSVPKEPILEDGNNDFNLFLSQTQEDISQKSRAARNIPARSVSSGCISKYAEASLIPLGNTEPKEDLLGTGRQNSIESNIATPSQSILPKVDKTEPSFAIITSVATELDISQAKGLDIPSDVLNKVSSNELSLPGCFHISPPPDGGSFRPIKTLTPPLRNIELNVESNQEEKHNIIDERKPAYQDAECMAASHKAESLHSKLAAAVAPVEGKKMGKIVNSESLSDIPKITGFPSNNRSAESSNNLSTKQGAKIPSISMKASMNVLKRNLPASATENDPFAFNEDEDKDAPQTKKRNSSLLTSQKWLPRPILPEDKSQSMTETFCKVVTEIIEVKEVTVTRKIVVKAHSMEDSDEAIYHQSEYSEGLPVRTVTEKSCGSSIEVVPLSSLSLKQQAKDKKTPKRQTPTRSCRKSPVISHKRRRSSSSTPPEGYTGVPKRLRRAKKPAEEDKHEELECKRPFASAAEGGMSNTKMQTRSNKSSDLGGSSVYVGMPVLGKWLDNCYYPGKIIEKTKLGRYKVRFHDEKELVLSENAIVPQHMLQQGQTVCARNNEDGFYYQATILRINRTKEGSAHSSYHVKLDDRGATKNVNVTDIMLDTKQISHVHSASKNIEDNISVRRHSHTQGANNTTGPKVVDTETAERQERQKQVVKCKRRLSEIRQRKEESTQLMISSSSPEVDSFQFRVHPRRRKNELSLGQQASSSANEKKVLCKVRKVKDPSEKVKERWERIEHLKNDPKYDEELRLFGSLPEDSTLFKGCTFLVTFIRSTSKVEEDVAFSLKNFKRSHISCQITAGGGTIIDSVKNLEGVSKKKFVLIAPICQKTLKYYFALCYGIPCVNHFWVIDCCKENRLLPFDEYFLEAGIDQITGAFVYAHDRTQPLRGFKIYVASLTEDRDELSLAVRFSGAEVVPELPKVKKFSTSDVNFILVGDNIVLKRSLISHTRKLNVLCVTLKWFFQCIIHGEFVNPQSSDLFIAATG